MGQPVFMEVVLVAINLSLQSGLPRATKRARLGLPNLPPPIRKPRVVEGKQQLERVTSPSGGRGGAGGGAGGREEPRMLAQHLRSPATLSPDLRRPNTP